MRDVDYRTDPPSLAPDYAVQPSEDAPRSNDFHPVVIALAIGTLAYGAFEAIWWIGYNFMGPLSRWAASLFYN